MELVVLNTRHQAQVAGFRPDGRHRTSPDILAWWPDRDTERLRGLSLSRITVAEGALRRLGRDQHDRLVAELRSRLRVPPMIWMEL